MVVDEGDFADLVVAGVEGDGFRYHFEEDVELVQKSNHVFAYGCAEGGCPAVFVGAVCCDEEDEVDVVFAKQEGVSVKQTVLEVFVGLGEPVCGAEGRGGEVEVADFYPGADEEVGRDVVAIGLIIAVADGVGVLLMLEIELIDVVLDGVAGVGELLVERDAFRVRAVLVVFAVADVVDIVLLADEGLVQVDMVHQLAVLLVLEVGEFAGISYEVVHHLLEDLFKVCDDQGFLDGGLVITAGIEGEECVQQVPEVLEVVAEVFPLHIAHLALADAGVQVALDLGRGLEVVRYVAQDDGEVELVAEIFEHRVIEDDEFLVDVHGLVLDAQIEIVGLAVLDERMLLDGLVPVHCSAAGVVYLIDLREEVAVVRQVVDQADCRAQEVTVARVIVRGDVVQIFQAVFVVFLDAVLAVARHGTEEPQAQFGEEGFTSLGSKDVVGVFCVDDAFRSNAGHTQQRQLAFRVRLVNLQEGLRQQEQRTAIVLSGHEEITDVLDIPSLVPILHGNNQVAGLLVSEARNYRVLRVLVSFEVDAHRPGVLFRLRSGFGSKFQVLRYEAFKKVNRGGIGLVLIIETTFTKQLGEGENILLIFACCTPHEV